MNYFQRLLGLFHEPTTEAWRAVGYRDWHNIWAQEQKSCVCVSETVWTNTKWNNKRSFDCVCVTWCAVWLTVSLSAVCLSVSLMCLQVGLSCWYQLASIPGGVSFPLYIHFSDSICHFYLFFSYENSFFPHIPQLYISTNKKRRVSLWFTTE